MVPEPTHISPMLDPEAARLVLDTWWRERSGRVCWLYGRAGSDKTATVLSWAAGMVPKARVAHVGAVSVDTALAQVLSRTSGGPVTTAEFVRWLDDPRGGPLVLDGLDDAWLDPRLRVAVAHAMRGESPAIRMVVTARKPPPAGAVTGIPCAGRRDPTGTTRRLSRSLEALAVSPYGMSGWMLALATDQASGKPSLATPQLVLSELNPALETDLVRRVLQFGAEAWFQVPEAARSVLLAADRAPAAALRVADRLQSTAARPYVELASRSREGAAQDVARLVVALRMDARDVEGAVDAYWNWLGNFSSLRPQGRIHLGADVCSSLNRRLPPDRVASALDESDHAWAVLNDWSQFAICAGDARTASEAARVAYARAPALHAHDRALFARDVADTLILRGALREAAEWASAAWRHAVDAARAAEGAAAPEVVNAFEDAASAAIAVASRMGGPAAVARELDALVEALRRGRRVLRDLNRAPLPMPYEGPTGDVGRDEVLDGAPAAVLAVLEDRPADAKSLLEGRDSTVLARALIAAGDLSAARALLKALITAAQQNDNLGELCEVAVVATEAALADGRADEALAISDAHLLTAAQMGLGLHWIDLLTARARALLALGRRQEAAAAATVALLGPSRLAAAPDGDGLAHLLPLPDDLPGAADPDCGYRNAAVAAIEILRDADAPVPDDIALAATLVAPPLMAPEAYSTSRTVLDVEPPTAGKPPREALHGAALRVLADYQERGIPFALYLRKYGMNILHGPVEDGPELLESNLRRALESDARLLAIQEHGIGMYFGYSTAWDRAAPALLLDDTNWQDVAVALIARADLIVSECWSISAGIRFELEAVRRAGRSDRTVLVLPPLHSYIPTIDNDPLIRQFPRSIWADEFHGTRFDESDVVADLITRMRSISAMPDEQRADLSDSHARDRLHPIDLLPLASRYEQKVQIDSAFADPEDDSQRYYGFWRLFRAALIRAPTFASGDHTNWYELADDYLQMSAIMLDHEKDGDRYIMTGDLDTADKLTMSAYLLAENTTDSGVLGYDIKRRAETLNAEIERTKALRQQHPDRFRSRLRYGPFEMSAITRSE